jgi:hypothetical protein
MVAALGDEELDEALSKLAGTADARLKTLAQWLRRRLR